MHSGGYLDARVNRNSPARLGLVIALHGAAITALMLAPPEVVRRIDWKPLDLIQIDEPPPPPPDVIPEKPQQQLPKEQIDQPTREVSGNTGGSTFTLTPPDTDGGFVEPPLTPITTPVRVDATFVRGAEIQPPYPSALARQEIEGVVTVRVLIGTDGRIKAVEQVSATDPEFFEATKRQALRHWRFKPATSDGVPIESWREMTVRFRLEA
jgi:periplasmic protein TonB